MYRLREVRPDDWEFWRTLHRAAERDTVVRQFGGWDEVLQEGFARQAWEDTRGERRVVVVDGEDAGWWHVREEDGGYFLHQIILHPDFQGRGIGGALLRDLMERARKEGRVVRLQTLLQNTAKDLYEKRGFVVTGSTATHWLMRWQP